jgi:hypothetical protein
MDMRFNGDLSSG